MKRAAKWWGIGTLVAIAVLVVAFYSYRLLDKGIAVAVEHKSAKRSTATVIQIVPIFHSASENNDSSDALYKICFHIDSFNEVGEMQRGYEAAEQQREMREGPRCQVTARSEIARHLRNGDKVNVVFLLENNYEIDVVSLDAGGAQL
jgi:hypothetical protein